MNSEAQKIIEEEKKNKTGVLKLSPYKGSYGLLEIPADLKEMAWLKKLDLSNHGALITEIKNLEALVNLQELILSGNEITEIKNLESLTNLQELNLSANRLTKIKNLESLVNLQRLDLSGNRLTAIENLKNLVNLQEFYVYSNQLTVIENLESLTKLEKLNLSLNQITEVSQLRKIVNRPSLKELSLYGITKNNLHIPAENFGKHAVDNCLPLLKAYFESIKKGATYIREVPVILVGNSTAGKTSLLHFIKQREYPPPDAHSTHGVLPDLWQPPQAVLDEFPNIAGLKGVQFYFWDFGGQEYYHATHRLFFSKAGVYVLVWDKQTNKQGVEKIPVRVEKPGGGIEKTELPVELFPYTYWLDTIRFFAPGTYNDAPIVLVQNKLDTVGYEKDRPANELFGRFGITESFHLSVQDAGATKPNRKSGGKPFRDFEDFLEHLLTLAKKFALNLARQTHWQAAKGLLQQHKDENVITTQQFLAYLQLIDPDINEESMSSYTGDLDAMGHLFYRPRNNDPDRSCNDDLKNVVFINPAWVTKTIYAVLDKETLAAGGIFNRQKVEANAGEEYTPAFIALLKNFELIFEDPDGYFIAPQYLPAKLEDRAAGKKEWNKLNVRFSGFSAPDFYLRFPDFMPRSIMLRFLAAYGAKAVGQTYWKNGIAFMLEGKEAVVLYDAGLTGFKIFVEDGDKYVQRLILDTLLQLINNKETLQVGLNAEDYVAYSELKKYYRNEQVATVAGKMIACAPLRHFSEDKDALRKTNLTDTRADKKPVKIFVSYSHEDGTAKDLLVNTHLKAIQNNYDKGLVAWTDAGIKPGVNWDHKIKKEIEAADIILFLITSRFLASDYIKNTEIKNALERFKEKKQIIVPVYIESVAKKLLPFKEKQYLPGGTPLKKWKDRSDAWTKIQEGIITLIDDVKAGNTGDYFE